MKITTETQYRFPSFSQTPQPELRQTKFDTDTPNLAQTHPSFAQTDSISLSWC